MEHNCYIGEWLDYENAELVTYDDLKEKVKNNNETFEYGLITYGENFVNGLMKQLKIKNYLQLEIKKLDLFFRDFIYFEIKTCWKT